MKHIFKLNIFLLAILSSFLFTACRENSSAKQTVDSYVETDIGGKKIEIQIAVTPAEKAKGLMFRRQLDENRGMLFVFEAPQKMSFWMKNTYIPLDIGFFNSEGVLTQVRQMYPNNQDGVSSARSDILYCLEMNSGWFAKNGIYTGAKLNLIPVEKSVKVRSQK